ncbi:hypothetical protein [Ammoniphilus sp. 3BR4]|uniref:hypothetical protein n=1 Tax=Ammoniphilus sp. 3BR4 TaxID=3158265 RepID=UPI0034678D3F
MPLLITITHHSFCLLMTDNLQNDSLTDYVLIASMGNDELAAKLTEQLRSSVRRSFDLKRCGEMLEKLMDPWRCELLSRKKGAFEIVLTGFYSSGRTGEITLRSSNAHINELVYPLRGSNEYLFSFIPPDPSLFQAAELLLELPDDDPTTLENYVEHFVSTVYPAIFTLFPAKVQRMGQLVALEKSLSPKSKPLFHQLFLDISETLASFPEREELKQLFFSSQRDK